MIRTSILARLIFIAVLANLCNQGSFGAAFAQEETKRNASL